ncbi:MAG TPA: hypothetical protein VMA98_04725 [Candidatus Acidoferrales bacterium]|nr:hypothetical protein [Candidatus Acidoferrales bacterium]
MALAHKKEMEQESAPREHAVEAIVLDGKQYDAFRHELESGANGEGKQLAAFLAKANDAHH